MTGDESTTISVIDEEQYPLWHQSGTGKSYSWAAERQAIRDFLAECDRLAEENRQLSEAGNELARWLSLGTSTRTSTTDLMLDLARWREVAGT